MQNEWTLYLCKLGCQCARIHWGDHGFADVFCRTIFSFNGKGDEWDKTGSPFTNEGMSKELRNIELLVERMDVACLLLLDFL